MFPVFPPHGVVTDDALDRADVAVPARSPARLFGDFEARVFQHFPVNSDQ